MTKHANDHTIMAARTAAATAAALLAGAHRLAHAVADPSHKRLRQSLAEATPVCKALVSSFPVIRGRVAGLVYQSVEYRGFRGSSALHVVFQMAELLLDAGERWLLSDNLSAEQLEKLAQELERALPGTLEDWMRTTLDPELAELERDLGASITDEVQLIGRPRPLAHIGRMISPYLAEPGRVVLADRHRRHQGGDTVELDVSFASDSVAVVTEGTTRRVIRGERLVWLFRSVVEAGGRSVSWKDLVVADMRSAADRMSGNVNESGTPRMVTKPDSLQRNGNRIRRELGKLSYHWHQDGQGARWDAGTE